MWASPGLSVGEQQGGVTLPLNSVDDAQLHRALSCCSSGPVIDGPAAAAAAGGFERLHYLIEEFFDVDDQVNPAFIK